MRNTSKVLYLLFLSLAFSCIENVDLNFKSEEPVLVLNCILNTDQDTVTAWISRSQSIVSSQSFETINDATITLFEEGKSIGEFIWKDSSAYILPLNPTSGKHYKIEAEIEGNLIWAETKIPNSVQTTIEKVTPMGYGNHYQISFMDDPNAENFYWVSARGNEKYVNGIVKPNIVGTLYSNFLYADDFNQSTYQNGTYKFKYTYYIRSEDKEFQGMDVEIIFWTDGINFPHEIFLLNTDYHLDKYMKSSILLEQMDIYMEESPNTYSPFPVYSNIQGGTGIFGSVNSTSKVFSKN